MSKVIIGAVMSLDGYMQDRHGSVAPLYPDLAALDRSEIIQEEIRTTGAVVMGRGAYDMAAGDFTGYEFQTPIFVVTPAPPRLVAKGENANLRFRFVTDGVDSAIRQAKAAAGDKDVMVVGGAATAQQLLRHRLVDEIRVGIAPVLLGGGLRFFGDLGVEAVQLEKIRVLDALGTTFLIFKVLKEV